MKTIKVIVEEDGSLSVDMLGFTGKECDKLRNEIAKEMGIVTKSIKKPEWYQSIKTVAQVKAGG